MRFHIPPLIILIAIVLAVPIASAHVPSFPEGNDSLETALHIDDPAKSIVVYASLDTVDEAQYYSFHMIKGERIKLGMIIPVLSADDFNPDFALIGPGLGDVGELPDFVERPEGDGYRAVKADRPQHGEYEGFSPSAYFELGDLDILAPADGEYYVAVFSEEDVGDYGLIVGYVETFTIVEFMRVPLDLLVVYQWEGQSPLEILVPFVLTVGAGLILLIYGIRRYGMEVPVYGLLGAVAGIFFLGSSAVFLYQTIYVLNLVPANSQVIITMMFMLIPLVLGITIIGMGLRAPRRPRPATRVVMVVMGLVALFLWAGYYVGPGLALIAAILPRSWASRVVRL